MLLTAALGGAAPGALAIPPPDRLPAFPRPAPDYVRFEKPPVVHANGIVDLQSEKTNLDTDLTVVIDGPSVPPVMTSTS